MLAGKILRDHAYFSGKWVQQGGENGQQSIRDQKRPLGTQNPVRSLSPPQLPVCPTGQSFKWTESQRLAHSSSDMVPGSVPGLAQASISQLASREGQ